MNKRYLSEGSERLLRFVKEAGNDYNLHSHTQFCDGRADMDTMARAAFESGLRLYGFSPHSPICVESGCNMTKESVAEYIGETDRLKELYENRVRILTGMEIDFISEDFGPHIDYFYMLPLDYRIGSVHFIPSQDGMPIDIDGSYERFAKNMKNAFHDDLRYVVEKYFEQELIMIERGGFDILGHLDKVAANAARHDPAIEDQHWYMSLVRDTVEAAVSAGILIEINTKSYLRDGRFFPARQWWPVLKEKGATLLINSDAHYPDKIKSGRAEALTLLGPELLSAE